MKTPLFLTLLLVLQSNVFAKEPRTLSVRIAQQAVEVGRHHIHVVSGDGRVIKTAGGLCLPS